jgi:hypothetical protein
MEYPSFFCEFDNIKSFEIKVYTQNKDAQSYPKWSTLEKLPCPGNIHHGPDISYCRLGIEIEALINQFSEVKSIDRGRLIIHISEEQEIHIKSDAQTIFYNAIWFILIHSKCSVFQYNQSMRSHYLPSSDPTNIFYILFSIYLTEDYLVYPDTPPDIDKFKQQMNLLNGVLNNLLERIRTSVNLDSDSVSNGLNMFNNLILLIDLQFEEYYEQLIKRNKSSLT